jgi:seryl-tRNA synthetase
MLDLKYLKEHYEDAREKLLTRHADGEAYEKLDADLERLMILEKDRRNYIQKTEELQQMRNMLSKEIGMKKRAGEDTTDLQSQVQELKQTLDSAAAQRDGIQVEMDDLLARIPNIPDDTVPVGTGEEDNREIRRWGEPRNFTFEPRQHFEVAEMLDILDLERAAKLSGARFSLLKGAGAKLERALAEFMLDQQTMENGYTEFGTPYIVTGETMYASGQLPKFEEDLFRLKHDKPMYLIPTSEVTLVNIHAGEILEERDLPKKYTALTPCFRSEAGSYGKDTRGIIRVHQFNKVEMVNITTPETSNEALECMTANAERILQLLEIPHRVVVLCTADMGFAAAKTHDIEVWLPGQNTYREISSCSNCTDFQARRAHIRYRPEPKGKPQYAHTLNGSGLAVGRTWIAVLENYQQEDGSVVIPEALRPYMNGCERITPEGLR